MNFVQIVCIPEEEADLNRLRTRVYCSQDISSISYSDNRLVFVDCFTLKLYIRSDIYDYRQISRVPVSVFAGGTTCIGLPRSLAFLSNTTGSIMLVVAAVER